MRDIPNKTEIIPNMIDLLLKQSKREKVIQMV